MSKKTYFLILLLVVVATYLAYLAAFGGPKKNQTNAPSPTHVTIPVYQATLNFSPNPLVIAPQADLAQGSFDVILDTGPQKATAVQLELSYDPKVLSNFDLKPGTFFDNPLELIKTIDPVNGRISYAVAIPPTGTEKQGKGVVATISFLANTQLAKATQISILPKTLVTAQGITTSILRSSNGGSVIFQTQGAVSPTAIPQTQSASPSAQ